jgi:hypothetical protein
MVKRLLSPEQYEKLQARNRAARKNAGAQDSLTTVSPVAAVPARPAPSLPIFLDTYLTTYGTRQCRRCKQITTREWQLVHGKNP